MKMSSGVEKLLSFDCLNINEFGVMQMNIHTNAHEHSLECPYVDKQQLLP